MTPECQGSFQTTGEWRASRCCVDNDVSLSRLKDSPVDFDSGRPQPNHRVEGSEAGEAAGSSRRLAPVRGPDRDNQHLCPGYRGLATVLLSVDTEKNNLSAEMTRAFHCGSTQSALTYCLRACCVNGAEADWKRIIKARKAPCSLSCPSLCLPLSLSSFRPCCNFSMTLKEEADLRGAAGLMKVTTITNNLQLFVGTNEPLMCQESAMMKFETHRTLTPSRCEAWKPNEAKSSGSPLIPEEVSMRAPQQQNLTKTETVTNGAEHGTRSNQ